MAHSHLKRKRQGWFARLVVPPELREIVGKRELTRTLKTRDVAEANRRKHAVLAELQRELSSAAMRRELSTNSPEYIVKVATEQRRAALANGENVDGDDPAGRYGAGMDVAADEYLDRLRAKFGTDSEGYPLAADPEAKAYSVAWRKFQGDEVPLLSEQVKQYIGEVQATVRAQTVQDKERVYRELLKWAGNDVEAPELTRKRAGKYVSEVMARSGKSTKTLKSELAQLSALWKWMVGRGIVEDNVWHLMSATLPKQHRGGVETHRRPWTEAELLRVLNNTEQSDPIWSAVALAAYSGMRLEEVCTLRADDLQDGALQVRVGKSSAAVRSVPVHPVIEPLVKQLAETSKDGYLLPGLLTAGRDGKRSVYLSKRIAYHFREVLEIKDKGFVFHGLRHTFANVCERAGIPLSTAQLIIGHSRRGSITYGAPGASYSHGLPLKQLADAVQKVTYGEPVDDLVSTAGPSVRVESKSRRRPRARRDVLKA